MTIRESEAVLEEKLIDQLAGQGYERITIKDEYELNENFKKQLGKHNGIVLSDEEFKQVMQYLEKPINIFEKSKSIRDKVNIELDNGDKKYIEFLNLEKWCKNIFQVTSQVTMINPKNNITNRYDVTLLINGLPVVQIELKRRGIALKEAYNQTIRYNEHTMHGLFGFIQLYVISNGVNTKYYANNKGLDRLWKQTFEWTDEKNKAITNLEEFAEIFLEKCHMAKMIIKYIVLNESQKGLMVLRAYQYNAVEKILEQVENSDKNGYIWHTTGSGKTLTSFKVSQILREQEGIFKVIFVVDRNDLDYQTQKEFNSFEKGSVDGTNNTNQLVKHISDPTKPLLITTIQKLNNAISKLRHSKKMEGVKDQKFIFIFDECHRSQFGETNKKIKQYFTNHQMFGFTGTPIFEENAIKGQTTKDLFGERLHEYTIKDAIKDDNVLGFSVEYLGKYVKNKEGEVRHEIMVEDIDTSGLFEDPKRLGQIVEYIRDNHDRKTFSKKYQSIFAISNIKTLIKYYDIFKEKAPNLKIATIFSFAANENKVKDILEAEEKGSIECDVDMDSIAKKKVDEFSRDALERFMKDYNETYGGNFTLNIDNGYNAYFKDVAKNMKERQIDVLLVVNMFLTGFDSKTLNTLYVDKNLRYHGLIQGFSRTNRILNEEKSHGNIVCFRPLKEEVDKAITLYSDKDASEIVLMKDYKEYVKMFNEQVEKLKELVPTVDSVNGLADENETAEFILMFRELIKLNTKLSMFTDFTFDDLDVDTNEFEGYKSKYLDIYEKVKTGKKDKVSILEDINFEIELLIKDEINVHYIIMLLKKLKPNTPGFKGETKKILGKIAGDPKLRIKMELIEEFIDSQMIDIVDEEDFEDKFEKFILRKKDEEFEALIEEEKLLPEKVVEFINQYNYQEQETPKNETEKIVEESFLEKLKFQEKRKKRKKVLEKIMLFIKKFDFGELVG